MTGKSDSINRADLEECLDDYVPENEEIVQAIIQDGTKATPAQIIEAFKNMPNINELKGKVFL